MAEGSEKLAGQTNSQLSETIPQGPTTILKVEGRSSRAAKTIGKLTPVLTGRQSLNAGSVYRPTAHYAIFDGGGSSDVVLTM